jgi:hypothetical protein
LRGRALNLSGRRPILDRRTLDLGGRLHRRALGLFAGCGRHPLLRLHARARETPSVLLHAHARPLVTAERLRRTTRLRTLRPRVIFRARTTPRVQARLGLHAAWHLHGGWTHRIVAVPAVADTVMIASIPATILLRRKSRSRSSAFELARAIHVCARTIPDDIAVVPAIVDPADVMRRRTE